MIINFRERFLENYMAVEKPCGNRDGFRIEYVYYGPWYIWDVPPRSFLVHKYSFAIACLLNIILFALASVQTSVLNAAYLVGIPGVLSLIALMYEILGVIQFCASKKKMTRVCYQGIHLKMKIAPLSHSIFMLLTVLACLYQLAFIQRRFDLLSASVLTGYAICSGLSALIYFRYRKSPFTTERNRAQDEYKNKGV